MKNYTNLISNEARKKCGNDDVKFLQLITRVKKDLEYKKSLIAKTLIYENIKSESHSVDYLKEHDETAKLLCAPIEMIKDAFMGSSQTKKTFLTIAEDFFYKIGSVLFLTGFGATIILPLYAMIFFINHKMIGNKSKNIINKLNKQMKIINYHINEFDNLIKQTQELIDKTEKQQSNNSPNIRDIKNKNILKQDKIEIEVKNKKYTM